MAQVKTICITVGRKMCDKVNMDIRTREYGLSATLEVADGEDVRQVLSAWTPRLQGVCDAAVGDFGPYSFRERCKTD
jgi:hypothetical protein